MDVQTSSDQAHTICQCCQVHCALLAKVQGGEVVSIGGDKNDPAYRGYSCIKGRENATVHRLPSRLTHSLERQPDGNFQPVASGVAAERIAARLQDIVARHGPRSVALFLGTYGYCNLAANSFGVALLKAMGSPLVFFPQTIDQPGKPVALGLHGIWMGGQPPVDSWDALMLLGTNPLVSMNGGLGPNPARMLNNARKRGMKLIVVDPRLTDCAQQADLHIQCRPGQDSAILAGITRELIIHGMIDREFIAAEAEGFDALAAAVAPFTPAMVADRAGVDAADIRSAAAILGSAARGALSAGTGANMSGNSAVTEYLVQAITTLRGWRLRAGDERPNPGVLIEPLPAIAGTAGPFPAYDLPDKLRVRGLGQTIVGFPTAALADEILLPGEGQIKALLVIGGNPVVAFPDQEKTERAMRELDLLVCFDPRMTQTARHADYVIAPKLQLEVETNSAANELWGAVMQTGWGYDIPYGIACPPAADPPAGSDVVEEWETLHAIATAMQLPLAIRSHAIMDPVRAQEEETIVLPGEALTAADAWAASLRGSPVSYRELRKTAGPQLFPRKQIIAEKPAELKGRLMIGAAPIMADLAVIAAEPKDAGTEFPLRLIARRLRDIHNSNWHDSPLQRRRQPYNAAYINPEDLAELDIAPGTPIAITSERGTIIGVAEPEAGLRRGCLSMSHGWGRNVGEAENPFVDGASTAKLSFTDRGWDRYSGIPLMSAIPVRIAPAKPVAEAAVV